MTKDSVKINLPVLNADEEDAESTKLTDITNVTGGWANQPQRIHAYLIVLVGSNVGEMFRVTDSEMIIGRTANASIRLDDESISRRHARLVQVDNEMLIEDLSSANGTRVNEKLVDQCVLQDGDKIRIGSTTILKFTYPDELDEKFQHQMYEAAVRDGLTKVFNKKYLLDRLETEVAYARRHQTLLAVVMMDLDHFKRINDNVGHLAGDAVLVKFTRLALTTIRTEDILARYGGEEFVIACRGSSLANAAALGERLRAITDTTLFEYNGQSIPVTISVGVASVWESYVTSGVQLIAAADEALYSAKRAGRNCVQLHSAQRSPQE